MIWDSEIPFCNTLHLKYKSTRANLKKIPYQSYTTKKMNTYIFNLL